MPLNLKYFAIYRTFEVNEYDDSHLGQANYRTWQKYWGDASDSI